MELKNFKIPQIYTTLCAFFGVKTFDEKDYIEIDKLIKYRKWLLNEVGLLDNWNEKQEYEDIIMMSREYPNFFRMDNSRIYISDLFTPDILDTAFQLGKVELPDREVTDIFDDFDFQNSNIRMDFFDAVTGRYEWIKILEITKFQQAYESFSMMEKEIEQSYYKDSNDIPLKLLMRMSNAKSFYEKHRDMVRFYDRIIHEEDLDTVEMDEDFNSVLGSIYTKNGEKYPIDWEVYEESSFYEDNDAFGCIQDLLLEANQYAIFGNGPLYKDKFGDYLDQLCIGLTYLTKDGDNNITICGFDSTGEIDLEDASKFTISLGGLEDEFAFYMVYLHKLNNMIESGNSSLIRTRQRLMYMIDDAQYGLTDSSNFDKWYNWACEREIEEGIYDQLGWEAGYFIQDVFEGEDYKSQEKLLFASTYYQLTKDPELKEVLEQYSDDDRYSEYSSIILGDTKGFTKRKK